MIVLFLWQTTMSIQKYETKMTSFQESLEDTGTIMYPSISFCVKNIWDVYPGLINYVETNESVSLSELKQFAKEHYYSVERVFNFVSHDVLDAPFPCNTYGGPDHTQGKPCSFPFLFQPFGMRYE